MRYPCPMDFRRQAHDAILAATLGGEDLTRDEFEDIASRAGREAGPGLLWEAWSGEVVSVETLRALLPGVWSAAETPPWTLPWTCIALVAE